MIQTQSEREAAAAAVYNNLPAIYWRGVPMDKCPSDLMVYQELIYWHQPDVILECGTWCGGSALFLADMCELNARGHVFSVDKAPGGSWDAAENAYTYGRSGKANPLPSHPRLTFLTGDTASPDEIDRIHTLMRGRTGMVILDSDHSKAHVLAEMDAYHDLVATGCFMVVEDTNVNGHPVRPDFGEGPWEAVQEWLPQHPEFRAWTPDEEPYLTFSPGGWLQRVGGRS